MHKLLPWLVGLSVVTPFTPVRTQNDKFVEVASWKQIDFDFPSPEARKEAVDTNKFVAANSLPLGLDVWGDRVFLTFPKWKPGIPATLGYISKSGGSDQVIKPFPNWKWHKEGNCNGLTSVFRISIDPCGRLWVIDSGVVDVLNSTQPICPSQIVVFDLTTDKILWRYRIPKEQVKEGSLFTNIITDVREGKCDEAFAYVADVFRYAIIVYDWKHDRSWRISHNLFFPDPIACRYTLDGLTFRWTDGVFGLALSPMDNETGDRTLYFHPMSSYREFQVPASILRNETAADANQELFQPIGQARGKENYHSSASGMDRNGILFYNLVTRNSVGCWNSKLPYRRDSQGSLESDSEMLSFPNDLKVDQAKQQNVWVISNKLHKYLYTELNPEEVNYRVLTAPVADLVSGTVCDPNTEYTQKTDDQVCEEL